MSTNTTGTVIMTITSDPSNSDSKNGSSWESSHFRVQLVPPKGESIDSIASEQVLHAKEAALYMEIAEIVGTLSLSTDVCGKIYSGAEMAGKLKSEIAKQTAVVYGGLPIDWAEPQVTVEDEAK
jgi:hypothetical protein